MKIDLELDTYFPKNIRIMFLCQDKAAICVALDGHVGLTSCTPKDTEDSSTGSLGNTTGKIIG